jgi:hypothetical protein|tara:strand:+ start:352 stop:495 length:144 start_codon:yes stop_codon:yes gene_type:complete
MFTSYFFTSRYYAEYPLGLDWDWTGIELGLNWNGGRRAKKRKFAPNG